MASAVVKDGCLTGKVIILTGGNAGLGRAAARALVKGHPKLLIIAARSAQKGEEAVAELRALVAPGKETTVEFMQLDLSVTDSVRAFVDAFLAKGLPLHVLINNAGLFGAPHRKTAEGLEVTLATNHFGPLLLTRLLTPALLAAGPGNARVIIQSSILEIMAGRVDWTDVGGAKMKSTGYNQYTKSKLYNLMTVSSLSRKLGPQGITVVACQPGWSRSEMTSRSEKYTSCVLFWSYVTSKMFTQSTERGAISMVYCTCTKDIKNGGYYGPNLWNMFNASKCMTYNSQANKPELADRLVDVSLKLVGAAPFEEAELTQ